ncbi:hypothetical protein Tco_0668905 [Tanacetum coccineum]
MQSPLMRITDSVASIRVRGRGLAECLHLRNTFGTIYPKALCWSRLFPRVYLSHKLSGQNAKTELPYFETKNKIGEKEREILDRIRKLARMERDMVERRLRASYGWNKRFYMEMVRIGTVPKHHSNDERYRRSENKSKKSSFDGTKGPSKPRGPPGDS